MNKNEFKKAYSRYRLMQNKLTSKKDYEEYVYNEISEIEEEFYDTIHYESYRETPGDYLKTRKLDNSLKSYKRLKNINRLHILKNKHHYKQKSAFKDFKEFIKNEGATLVFRGNND